MNAIRRDFANKMYRPVDSFVLAPLALDPLSAALAKQVGFEAIYLGGGALGYARAVSEALLTASEVTEAARAIIERVEIAVVADISNGFGDAVHTARTIRMLEQVGVVAVEVEDQVAPKRAHHHKGIEHLVSTDEMVGKIKAAADARWDHHFIIIARCNAIRHEGLDAALERAARYAEAGADMLMMLPRTPEEFMAVTTRTTLPLAGMAIGPLRPAAELMAAGYPLVVEPMSATVLVHQALKRGYESLRDSGSIGMSAEQIRTIVAEAGATMQIEKLYEIEARTTERESYATQP